MEMAIKIIPYFLLFIFTHISFGVPQNISEALKNREEMNTILAENNSVFAFDLFRKLNSTNTLSNENLCFSPYSITTVLAMAYAGARNQTASEMAKTLHFEYFQEFLHTTFFNLASIVKESCRTTGVQFSIANSLWPHNEFPLSKSYIALLKGKYLSSITALNYITDTENARVKINAWVEKETQCKINNLLQPGTITPATRLVLVNAIYFKGNWDLPFSPKETHEEKFHISPTKSASVPLMHRNANFNYAQFEKFSLLELPYKGYGFSMLILLPNTIDGLIDLEKLVDTKTLKEWANSLQSCKVNLYLPKFKVATGFSLVKTLQEMGMSTPFGSKADFSGIGGKAGDLYISDVIHKAVLEVNEQGSEAAAATATTMCMASLQNLPKDFRADHPFIFILRENTTGTILFMGKIVDPNNE